MTGWHGTYRMIVINPIEIDIWADYDSYEVTGCDGNKYLKRRLKSDIPPVETGPYASKWRKITKEERDAIAQDYMDKRKAITSMKDHFCDTMAGRRHPT